MNPSILASYAILKVNWEQPERKDYLDNFVLLVAEAIRHLPQDIISISDLQSQIRNLSGFNIPQNTINSLLTRVQKKGYINIDHGTYTRNPKKLEHLHFSDIQQKVLRSYELLIDDLKTFVSNNYHVTWTEQQTERLLEEYLQENQIILLNDLLERKSEKISDISQIEPEPQYIIAKYIEYLQNSQSNELDFLETVVKGNLLANSIFFSEPGQYQRRFKNTSVYLDTPLIICALGYAGEPRKWPVTELINLLKTYGAHLKIFRHSIDEIIGILSACAEKIRRKQFRDSYGSSLEYFIGVGFSETDIMMLIENLEQNLTNNGISIVDKPPYNDYSVSIDEEQFCKYLKTEVPYSREAPLERDKDSITAILRLRGGQSFIIFEECHALFVTSNLGLARCALNYPEFNFKFGTVPLVLSDYELTNLVWLKNPKLSSNLPRRRLLADAYASTQPRESLWTKYLGTIDQLKNNGKITSDQYFILRHSIQAKSELMEKTRNDERVFTEGTVEEILKSVEERIRAEDVVKLNSEIKAKEKIQQEYENEREARVNLEEKTRQDERERISRIKQRANATSKVIAFIFEFFVALILVYFTYLTSSIGPLKIAGTDISPILKIIGYFIFWLLLIFDITNSIWDIGPKFLSKRIQEKLAGVIENYLNP